MQHIIKLVFFTKTKKPATKCGLKCLAHYKFNKILCTSIWFQVYAKNDFHITHTHPQCNFSNVLYIELPDNNLTTNIYDLSDNKIDINIEEGNIVTFPSFYRHNSPKNTTDKSKIVISFNTDVEM